MINTPETPIKPIEPSPHELRLLVIGLCFIVAMILVIIFDGVTPDWARVAAGAAGAAFVLFAQTESTKFKCPLTLGHQLVMWWYWPLIMLVFFLVTRDRRPTKTTLMIIAIFGLLFAFTFYVVFSDLSRIL